MCMLVLFPFNCEHLSINVILVHAHEGLSLKSTLFGEKTILPGVFEIPPAEGGDLQTVHDKRSLR